MLILNYVITDVKHARFSWGGTNMYEKEKREIIHAALEIKANRLISISGGNVSVRTEAGHVLVTPSGMEYEGMVEDDIIVLTLKGERVEGTLRESVDTVAMLYIYERMPEVNAIIHTHQPYATAVGLIQDVFPVALSTLANVVLGDVKVAPYSSPASIDMGIQTVNYIGNRRAVILKHHGVIAVGPKLKDAVYAAVYMEDAARAYLAAKAAGTVTEMTPEQIENAVEVHKTYGQR
jgi:L-ribulose-5-phosphate 4-epimerase